MKMEWTKKDLVGLEYLTKEEIEHILTVTDSFKEVNKREIKKVPVLRGKLSTFFMSLQLELLHLSNWQQDGYPAML
jgi:aspartate carbamoyltransferase catalytic subunit